MQTPCIKSNNQEITPDNQIYAYEKRKIDRALQEIEDGKTYSLDEVESELLNAY